MHRRTLLAAVAFGSTGIAGCTVVSSPDSVGDPNHTTAADVDLPERNVEVRDGAVLNLLPPCPNGGDGVHRRREREISASLVEPEHAYEWVDEQVADEYGEPTLLLGVAAIEWKGATRQLSPRSHLLRAPGNRTFLVLPRDDGTVVVEYWAGFC